jgi:hypothetical protein
LGNRRGGKAFGRIDPPSLQAPAFAKLRRGKMAGQAERSEVFESKEFFEMQMWI